MSTASNQELQIIKQRIAALKTAISNGDKIVRYADGTYIEFNSFDDLAQRLKFFEGELAKAETSKPRPTGFQVRVNRGVF